MISPVPALTLGPGTSSARVRPLWVPGALTPPPQEQISPAENAAAAAAAAPVRAAASTVGLVKGALMRPAAPLREARPGSALAGAPSIQDDSGPRAAAAAPTRPERAARGAADAAPRDVGIELRGPQVRRASLLATA